MNEGMSKIKILDVHTVVDGAQIDRYFTMEDGTLIHCSTDVSTTEINNRWYELCDNMPEIIVGAQ